MKLGRIRISEAFFEKDKILDLCYVMAEFVPLHIEQRLNHGEREYTGVSADFEDIAEGTDIPLYIPVIKTGKNGKVIEVIFEKVNP